MIAITAHYPKLPAGLSAHRAGRLDEAERLYREALEADPGDADALHLLGTLLGDPRRGGDLDEAMKLLTRAAQLDPSSPQVQLNLGCLLGRMGRHGEAVERFRSALRLRPDYPEAAENLATALGKLRRWRESAEVCRRVVAQHPDFAPAHCLLGDALRRMGKPLHAAAAHRRAARLRPNRTEALAALAADCGELGMIAEATECHRKIAALAPNSASAGSDYLHLLHYDPAVSRERLLEEARRWAKVHAEPRREQARPRENDRDPDRPVRVGFVSADFREHPVARLSEPILRNLDRARFSTFCYSDVRQEDELTKRIRKVAGTWRETAGMSDETLAELIRSDQIDILVDLAGHMGGHRLTMFALKPAPVQATHFNYPDTTGMTAMDWRITDDLAEPAGSTGSPQADHADADPHDHYSVERLARLPGRGWCYQPTEDGPAVGPLPALTNGYVTCAALNKPIKHSTPCIALWARVLKAVTGSKLMLLGFDDPAQNRPMIEQFAPHGISPDRLRFVTRRPRRKYLALYNEADLSLDPFPYNGGVTSCDSLWMGVPFVALEGSSYLARQGLMLLTNVGLSKLIARSEKQYVELAATATKDLPRLAAMRARLRQRFAHCPITNGPGFARDLGAMFRRMWRDWCAA